MLLLIAAVGAIVLAGRKGATRAPTPIRVNPAGAKRRRCRDGSGA